MTKHQARSNLYANMIKDAAEAILLAIDNNKPQVATDLVEQVLIPKIESVKFHLDEWKRAGNEDRVES